MARKLKVTYQDGSAAEVLIVPRLELAYERNFHASITTLSDRVENFYWLAWKGLSLAGKESRDFESFVDVLDDVEVEVGATEEDPTRPPQSPPASSG